MKLNFRLITRSVLLFFLVNILFLQVPTITYAAAADYKPEEVQDNKESFVTVPAEINKSFTPIAITAGGISKLRVTIYNLNANDLTGASWTDAFPPGILIASVPNIVNTCGGAATDGGGGALLSGDTSLMLTGGTVPAQSGGLPGDCYVEVDVTSYTAGNLINMIPASGLTSTTIDPADVGIPPTPVAITNTTPASATLNVIGVASPSLSKNFAPNTMFVGATSTLTITVHNNDLTSSLTNLTLTDFLPTAANGDVVLATPLTTNLSGCGAGTLTNSADVALSVGDVSVKLSGATVARNSDCIITVNVTSTVQGAYTNTIPAGPGGAGSIQTQQGVTNASPASAPLNVQAFTLGKSFGDATIPAGGETVVTISIQNHAPFEYTGAGLVDTLPVGLVFVPGTLATTCDGAPPSAVLTLETVTNTDDTIRLATGALPANTTCTITASARALMNTVVGNYTNNIAAGTLTTDQGATNHGPASATVGVVSLSGSKAFDKTEMAIGDSTVLTITLSNPSPNDFTVSTLADILPNGSNLFYSAAPLPATTCVGGGLVISTTNTANDTLTLSGGTIPGGSIATPGTCTITVTVFAANNSPTIVHTNTIPAGGLTTVEGGTNVDPFSATIEITGLEVDKSFSPTTFAAGSTSTLTITITNPATIPLTAATLSDILPELPNDELFFAAAPAPSTTCGAGAVAIATTNHADDTINMTVGTIPAAVGAVPGTCIITATVTTDPSAPAASGYDNVIPAGNIGNTQGVSNNEPAEATVNVVTATLVKAFQTSPIAYPATSRLRITINNPATGVALTGITLTDNLPAGLIIAATPNASTTCVGGSVAAVGGGNSVTLNNGTLAAGPTSCYFQVYVTADPAASSTTLTNSIPVGALGTTQGVTNSSGTTRSIQIRAVSVTKAFQYSGFQAGNTNILTITLNNATGVAYTGVNVSDTLPVAPNSNLEFTGVPVTTCTSGGAETIALSGVPTRTVTLTNGTIPANSTCTITAIVTADVGSTTANYTNTIPVGDLTTGGGTGPSNTTAATAPVQVYTQAQGMTATKSFTPAGINIFGNSRLALTFTAPPDTALTGFAFTDNLPAGVTVSNSTAPTASASCGALGGAWPPANGATVIAGSGGTIAANATCTISVYVTSDTGSGPGILYTNEIEPTDITNNETRTIPVTVSAGLTVSTPSTLIMQKAFYPSIVSPNGLSRLTITLENESTTALINVTLDDFLPGTVTNGLIVAAVPNATTTCGSGVITFPTSQTVHMANGSIPARVAAVNGLCTISVNVQGKSSNGAVPATHTNTIAIGDVVAQISGNPSTMNPQNPATADLTIQDMDLEIVKGFAPQLVYGGATSTMSIILRNPNLGADLIDMGFTDTMPAGMILNNPPNFDATDCGPAAVLTRINDNEFTFSGGFLAPGDECTLTLTATMTVNGNLTNTIPIGGVTTFNGVTNASPTSATLTNLAGASVSKDFQPDEIVAGLDNFAILTITIRTTTTVNITGMNLVDTLPLGLEVAGGTAPAPTNTCGGTVTAPVGATAVQLTGGALPIGFSDCVITVPVTGPDPGVYENIIAQGELGNDQGISNIQQTRSTLTLTPFSLGNRVWFDTNNNGLVDLTEVGVENVRVELYLDDGGTPGVFDSADTFLEFDTTDVDGYYRFDALGAGDYIVVIPGDNFRDVGGGDTVAGDPLGGYQSSGTSINGTGTVTDSIGTDPDNDTDNDDNGVSTFNANALDYVSAQAITLGPTNTEPTLEGDPVTNPEVGEAIDDQSNRTVDFGFYRLELGDLVFFDIGIEDGNFVGGTDVVYPGVPVQLFASDGTTEINVGPDGIWGTADDAAGGMVTDAGGNYLFTGLPAGQYIVAILPPGHRSTIDTANLADTTSPNINADDNDNGVGVGDRFIVSNIVTLTPGSIGAGGNNTVVNATATTFDPTVDFGVVPSVSIGTLVWEDLNKNGIQDAGEPGIAGVTFTLMEEVEQVIHSNVVKVFGAQLEISDNTELRVPSIVANVVVQGVAPQTTGSDGLYYFGGLPEGSYRVQVVAPDGYVPTNNQNTADDDDNVNDSNIQSSVGSTHISGLFTLTVDGELDGINSSILNSDDADDIDDNNGNMSVDFGFIYTGSGARNPALLPSLGFAPHVVTTLPEVDRIANEPYQYYEQGLTLEIAKLGVNHQIVGVPLVDYGWNTNWIGNEIAYLEGTAFPTTLGNTALSAHSYLATGNPGPFVGLEDLVWGDEIKIHFQGKTYVYEVREHKYVSPNDLSVLRSSSEDILTLITCDQFDEASGEYLWRTVVQAILVDIISD